MVGGGNDEAVLATAKTGDIAVCVAVRGWGGGVLAVAVVTAKTGGGDVDTATRGGEIVTILATDVAKTENEKGEIVAGLAINVVIAKTEEDLFSIRLKRIEAETEGGRSESAKNIIKSENGENKNVGNI